MKYENKKLYPLQFENIYKTKIWGSNNISDFDFKIHNNRETIGEVLLLTDNDEKSIIKNGYLKGMNINEVLKLYKTRVLGNSFDEDNIKLPILIKYIISKEDLSYQIHLSKKEVMYALEKSEIKHNTNLNKEQIFKNPKALEKDIEKLILKEETFAYINSRTLHSLKKDSKVLEISNNVSDTYRLYDYNRNRKMNLTEGLKYVELNNKVEIYKNKFKNENFKISKKIVIEKTKIINNKNFIVLISLTENLKIVYNYNEDKNETKIKNELVLEKYKTLLIPNEITELYLIGTGKYLKIEILD